MQQLVFYRKNVVERGVKPMHANIRRVTVILLTIAVSIAVSASSVLAWPTATGP